jgi:hypothetical protein
MNCGWQYFKKNTVYQAFMVLKKINEVAKDYGNVPFFVWKAGEARRTIDKYGFLNDWP